MTSLAELRELKKILRMYNNIEDRKHLLLALTNPSPQIVLESLVLLLRDFAYRCVEARSKECPEDIDYFRLYGEIEYIVNYIDYDPLIIQETLNK